MNEVKTFKKKLTIVVSDLEESFVKNENNDLLALSLISMQALDNRKLKYFVMEDFLPREDVEKDAHQFSQVIVNWMESCDQVVFHKTGIARSFSSNGFWFLHRFYDIRYIFLAAKNLKAIYQNIEIILPSSYQKTFHPNVDLLSLNLSSIGSGLEHFIYFLIKNIPQIQINPKFGINKKYQVKKIKEPYKNLLKRLPDILSRRGKILISQMITMKKVKPVEFWIIQGGYDIDIIKQRLTSVSFFNFTAALKKWFNTTHFEKPTNNWSEIEQTTKDFTNNYFGDCATWFENLIRNYTNNVVSHLPIFIQWADDLLKNHKPKALLYSLGAASLIEDLIALRANKYNIPVYFFKHGGIENYFSKESLLDNYFEFNNFIKRTQFLHSKVEENNFNKNLVKTVVCGVIKSNSINAKNKKTRKILYSVGPPSHWSLKDVFKITLDSERLQFVNGVISNCQKHNVNLDIKVHPAEWEIAMEYFDLVLKNSKSTNTKIQTIVGGSIERLFDDYDAVVLDILSTRVFSALLQTSMPIILYLPKGVKVNDEAIEDLKNRVMVVQNGLEIEHAILKLYNDNQPSTGIIDAFNSKYIVSGDALDKIIKQFYLDGALND